MPPNEEAVDALLICMGAQHAWVRLVLDRPDVGSRPAARALDAQLTLLRTKLTNILLEKA